MALLSAAETVRLAAQPILEFARGWMLHPATAARGEELGLLPGRGFWVCGRNGVLGDVDADVVTAAIGFIVAAIGGATAGAWLRPQGRDQRRRPA